MQFLLITLLSTAAHLENRIIAQTFLLRPVIALPLVGLWLGDFSSGLLLALPAELLFIGERRLGSNLPPEPAPALLAVLGGSLLVLLIGLPAAWGFASLTHLQLKLNERYDNRFDDACQRGDRRRYERLFRLTLLRSSILSWSAGLLLTTLAFLLQQIPVSAAVTKWSASLLTVVFGITIATAIQTFYRRERRLYTYLGILLGSVAVLLLLLMRGDQF
jgi:PTS system mannose-specific IIC component/fructoselysine and glucoselysine-specific PTS system IIC component